MLHPFISTLLRRPNLLIDHASAYAGLIREEASEAGADLVQRLVAWVLVGIFAMLGATAAQFHWALVAVPGFALVVMVIAFFKARQPGVHTPFAQVKAQLDRDAQALRSAE